MGFSGSMLFLNYFCMVMVLVGVFVFGELFFGMEVWGDFILFIDE